jgi:hypothetical protein
MAEKGEVVYRCPYCHEIIDSKESVPNTPSLITI